MQRRELKLCIKGAENRGVERKVGDSEGQEKRREEGRRREEEVKKGKKEFQYK